MNRRTFLKIAGLGSIAAAAAGCSAEPEKTFYAMIHAPDDIVPGKPTWYAATCRECPAGCGVLAKNREDRVIKVEGNPNHPINRGGLCMRGQAALQGIYDPDRLKKPLVRDDGNWRSISFEAADALIARKAGEITASGPNRVRILSEITGDSLQALFTEALQKWHSAAGPVCFEPYAYESLKAAYDIVLGSAAVPSLHLDKADLLIGFGADFLETWLSPVEYARKFKAMHAVDNGKKGAFVHVGPFQSLTAANADCWLPCRPGGEAVVIYGLIREMLTTGRGTGLPADVREDILRLSEPFTAAFVSKRSGISETDYRSLARRLQSSGVPLILGAGIGPNAADALQIDVGALLLNRVLDPKLSLFDFENRHRIEKAARRSDVLAFLDEAEKLPEGMLFLYNTNPVFTMPAAARAAEILSRKELFVVSFSGFMDETAMVSDLIYPVQLPLETWDTYEAKTAVTGLLQPAMGRLTQAPAVGDVLLRCAFDGQPPVPDYKSYVAGRLISRKQIETEGDWVAAVRAGGLFAAPANAPAAPPPFNERTDRRLSRWTAPAGGSPKDEMVLIAAPSIRFFDGRGANKSWLCEVPDPLTLVAWQTVVQSHPKTMAARGWKQGDILEVRSASGTLNVPVYETSGVHPSVLLMPIGQGHRGYGRNARNQGHNPLALLDAWADPISGGPGYQVPVSAAAVSGSRVKLAHEDGSRFQHGRKIALAVGLEDIHEPEASAEKGLGMWEFPFTLPLPEGYSPERDMYPPHPHVDYRWGMAVDLDRCIGCGACAVACYAENNIGMVGQEQILAGREMAWMRIERYLDPDDERKVIFLPMLCQHCDNAPCESVCPVYAPHHSKEGLNNQIYNRCIGTRFCGQNCPYKVRRFNWLEWQWPGPLSLQLNPDVTVRSKGVMEKCSFCVHRIKDARDAAKNEKRKIRDGEVIPACVQSCPTQALVFGNFMDPESALMRKIATRRAYQVLGYLNTKPAVIYLKKVLQKI